MQNKHIILQNWNDENVLITDIITNVITLLNFNNNTVKNEIIEVLKNHNGSITPSDKWFHVLKILAICSVKNNFVFSQSQIYDLLTIFSRIADEKKKEVVNTVTFNVYKDVMENHHKLEENLKLIYPVIIVNLMHIIKYNKDIDGNLVNLFSINNYYQKSKSNINQELQKIRSFEFQDKRLEGNNTETISILELFTGRTEKDLLKLYSNLQESDQKKIADLCSNYQKIQDYGKLIETENFSDVIEKEIGRKLSDSQLQHAANSIKKTKVYLENVLDGGFIPKGKHGINHVKHNIEYGFQLMGIIQSKRRKSEIKEEN
ncbi:MAG: hypothetical protein ACE5SW_06425 [Nitrososphaeraceae archaeon]